MASLVAPTDSCITAMGIPKYAFWCSLARAVTVCVAVPVGYHLGGTSGLLWGAAMIDVPDPERCRRLHEALGLHVPIASAPTPALAARIRGPGGDFGA